MKRSLRLLFLFLTVGFFTSNLLSQTVNITYVNPLDVTVCDTALFEITLTNNTPDSVKDVTVASLLPSGLSYVLMSVTNAGESNVSNLGQPVFSVPNMGSGDVLTLTFRAETDCSLIGAINSGSLFENTYTVDWTGGSNTQKTIPYIIETPLILITNVTNAVASGTKGEVIIRTITFTNTRLGALSKITVRDVNNGGILISTDFGMVSDSDPQNFEIMLTGSDFQNVGDGDEFFELNEEFTLTQTIEITDCGFDFPTVESLINVSWGCGGIVCQDEEADAEINLIPSTDNPDLEFTPMVMLPTDYCGSLPVEQGMTITNNGSQPATAVQLTIAHMNDGVIGIIPGTFVVDSAGITTSINADYSSAVIFSDCGNVNDKFDTGIVFIPILGPGETIKVTWQIQVCAVGCGSPFPEWFYTFRYLKSCPVGDDVLGGGSNSAGSIPTLMTDSVTYQIGQALMDGQTYTMNYDLSSAIIQDSLGTLTIDFLLPCGLNWGNSPMILGGNAPVNTEIVNVGGGTSVTLTYDLPLGLFNVNSDFTVVWDCSPDCVFKPPCDIIPVTTCENICSGAGFPQNVHMQVISTINLDTLNNNACGIQECQDFDLVYECTADSICWDTIVGWLDYEMEFFRTNIGLRDDDDDRFADSPAPANLGLIRRDRALTGDTVRTHLAGTVQTEFPDGFLRNGAITVSFEAHTADDGIDGGQAVTFSIDPPPPVGPPLMFDNDGFRDLDAVLRIVDASTGAIYECAITSPPVVVEAQFARLTVPNTRPEQVLDEVYFMTYTYDISASSLSCLPADFVYEQGDSVVFTARHKVIYNAIEFGSPRIYNLRTGTAVGFSNGFFDNGTSGPYQLNPFVCNCQSVFWQLSGYRFLFSPGIYDMPPCASSDVPGGTRFDLILGRGNFFPNEFRHLAYIKDWLLGFDPQINLLNSEMLFLQLQNPTPLTLYANQDLDVFPQNQYMKVDLDEFQNPALDEGFSIRFIHEWEMPCQIENNLSLDIHAIIDLAPSLPEFHPMDTVITGFGTFRPQRPQIGIIPDNPHYVSLDNTAEWILDLTNFPAGFNGPAPNVWLTVTPSTNKLKNFQLIDMSTGMSVPMVGDIFQIGDFPFGTGMYQLIADNMSCDEETVTVTYGWNCDPFEGMSQPCWQDDIELTVSTEPGELEMFVQNPITPVDLCDTVPYHTIEIFNAQIGTVYEVNLDILIPDGFVVAPGSAQISFPTGSPWVDIPDPTDLGGGVVQWQFSQISAAFADAGLKGFNQSPDHSISVRFKGLTECGFIASSQLFFTATGQQNCDNPTNSLQKAGDQIHITGVTPPYIATIDWVTNAPTTVACGEDFTFSVTMTADGVTLENDSIFIDLPTDVTYVPGSYVPNPNADPNEPFIDNSGGAQTLKWPISEGLSAGSPISFELTIEGFGVAECDAEHIILIRSVQKQEAVCVADGTLCEVLAETGSNQITVTTTHPDFELQNFTVTTNGMVVAYNVNVLNNGDDTEQPLIVDFYLDNDGNGVPSAGDVLLDTKTFIDPIGMGGLVNVQGTLNIDYEDICNIIAVIDANQNCICDDEVLSPLGNLINQLAPVTVCSGEDESIGIGNIAGHDYTWNPPDNLSQANTSMTTFNYVNNTDMPQQFNYTLFDDDGTGCVIQSTITVTVPNVPGIITQDTSICQGSTITLEADIGMSYNWTGEGITDPTLQNQTVTLNQPGTFNYEVNITDNNGCDGFDAVSIDVIEAPKQDSVLSICEGTIVDVFGTLVSQATTVFGTLPNPAGGCDILVEVQVLVQGVLGDSDLFVCLGDSTQIPGTNVWVYEDSGMFIDTLGTPLAGCDSVHTYFITPADTVILDVDDFGCVPLGDDFVLSSQLPDIYDYDWTVIFGPGTIDCDTCANPTFTPAGDSTIYQVIATTEHGCARSFEVNVQVLPECGREALDGLIPNAFTPDGDGMNDLFGVVDDARLEKLFDGTNNGVSLTVWNRWGQKVFEGENITNRWDGNFENEPSQSEVYVYLLEVTCGQEVSQIKGDVTLLR